MGKFLYNIFITLYPFAAGLLSLFNDKARKWVHGRRDIFETINNKLHNDVSEKIWIHCASLGEFEQGRPVMEALKKNYPQKKIVLTFFSPSGYEVQKNYSGADFIFYLPVDSRSNANKFYDLLQPKLIVFVKYEFWYYYLSEAKKRNIPLLLVSGTFRSSQPFFKWYGSFYRKMLHCFSHLFVQNEWNGQLLHSIGIQNISVAGDTRFDRVLTVERDFEPVKGIENFTEDKMVIVAGSTWTEDDEELDHYANTHPEIKFIIAPHDISEERLVECEKLYRYSIRYSQYVNCPEADIRYQVSDISIEQTSSLKPQVSNLKPYTPNTLIIDNIGMLKRLYAYATVCYIGGGFGGDGVHNVLEAAVYNKPVLFGTEYGKYIEAVELVEEGGAFSVKDALELEEKINELLNDKVKYKIASVSAGSYVSSKAGATKQIMQYIQEKRLLTI